MIVEQIWTGNDFRNFNYLIACPETGEAIAVDPLDAEKCLGVAKSKGWDITQILNTHHHHDHIGGNEAVVKQTGAKVLAHSGASSQIPGMDIGLKAGDLVKLGNSVELQVMDTPGHTMSHVCLKSLTDIPALFAGDTLFNAGAGNCKGGGHPDELYNTFNNQLAQLPDNTLIYPGHDYIINNLEFTLDREPENNRARALLIELENHDPNQAIITNIGLEREINTFLRLNNDNIINKLRERFSDLPDILDEKTVFIKLRELRNTW
ncbi:MAG: hydroxyacylglutathione hydrolase [Rhodospirillaceae bacterium]|nr:hydroxyacylglutathione hydrolase [Rhodospirillaceae bacterium]